MEEITIDVINTSTHHQLLKECTFFHKPTEHQAWLAHKTALNERHGKGGKAKHTIFDSVSTPKPSVTPSASKLSLAKSLQEALTTTAGLTDDQFKKIWETCCNALGK
jgi:hypothetical protein